MYFRPCIQSRGFSLIEAIVSIALLGVLLLASAALMHSIPLTADARDQDIALKIASTKIDALRALGYVALPASGTFTDPTLNLLASSAATMAIATFNAKTKQVDVTVSWLARDQTPRSLVLTTLITHIGGL